MPKPVGTVLLVEDNSETAAEIEAVLRQYGYEVLTASGGPGAELKCESHKGEITHLLVKVLLMTRTNGQLLAQRLAKKAPGAKIAFISSSRAQSTRPEGFPLLAKPFAAEDVMMTITRAAA